MAKVDPRDFLLNTDYEMDKIIFFKEGTLNAGDYNIDITHNLPFTPLVFGVCAFNSDFSDARAIPYEQLTQTDSITFDAPANSSVIRMAYTNTAGTPNKIYYRLYAFEPSDSRAKVGATSKYAKDFILNTDYNYCKLFKAGTVSGASDTTISHNLGYIPQVLVWSETSNGWVSPIERADWGNIQGTESVNGVMVTTTEVQFKASLYQFDKIHYRIYFDEA